MPRSTRENRLPNTELDKRLPTTTANYILTTITTSAPVTVTGARDEPEGALKNLLIALANLGLITNSTTAT